MSTGATEWIAVDWGTSNLRVWAMQGDVVLARAGSDAGMGGLTRDGFGPALAALTDDWGLPSNVPVIACGMVGSRQGWVEAPYRSVPCTPLGDRMIKVPGAAKDIRIIPGLKQDTPADVMRGEETQIAGFLALNPNWDGVICLPGTHAKWVQISAGEVVSFQTFMTGELFALISTGSVLRHSVQSDGWDADAFVEAVSDTLSRPEKLAARLFSIRAEDLLNATPAPVSRARLSGALIGTELAAARPYWLGQQVAIIGADATARHYVEALAAQGVPATLADAERMTLAGLTAAYKTSKVTS
ncbi:2-dehydro-3-deoxygalactonokinase [Sulfitobacter sp. SK011]|uniref:2-dehydro-3-deoxygalactonokinase n=1 Tax=Sulfitobacter sp. SK011 TaxID=1389004 RepID=UPI000E0B878D|nr:2-dehydro-3-deoxygalactonokinase [Sulfitobacter sp. SK011]AXI42097.1 2-keto-3-deoxy-galactonokinase [Sulfitobacter sp. SK011]